MMEIEELQGFFITSPDGYTALEYYADPDGDENSGEFIMYVDAGDTLVELVEKAQEFKRVKGIS